jgi:hypothetical protein
VLPALATISFTLHNAASLCGICHSPLLAIPSWNSSDAAGVLLLSHATLQLLAAGFGCPQRYLDGNEHDTANYEQAGARGRQSQH